MLIQQLLLLVLVMLIWQTTTANRDKYLVEFKTEYQQPSDLKLGHISGNSQNHTERSCQQQERFMLMTVRRSLVLLLQLQLIVTICNNYVKLTNVQSNAFNALNTNDIFPMLSLIMLMIAPDFWGSWYWRHLAMQLVTVIFTRRHLNTSNRIIVTQPLFGSVTI